MLLRTAGCLTRLRDEPVFVWPTLGRVFMKRMGRDSLVRDISLNMKCIQTAECTSGMEHTQLEAVE